jgi:hypothetical protein
MPHLMYEKILVDIKIRFKFLELFLSHCGNLRVFEDKFHLSYQSNLPGILAVK